MTEFSRRKFLEGCVVSSVAAVASPHLQRPQLNDLRDTSTRAEIIDFRFAPRLRQATICFPDDSKKSLVGQVGDLRYDFAKEQIVGCEDFATVCSFRWPVCRMTKSRASGWTNRACRSYTH